MTRTTLMLIACSLLAAAGCAGSPPARFYVLNPLSDPAQSAPAQQGVAVGVGPVDLPEYLDRPQIVTRTDQNELRLADFDRWAGTLKDNVNQVLAENLSLLLPSQGVVVYPWKRSVAIDYQIVVKLIRFDRSEGGDSVLEARWSVLAGSDRRELQTRVSVYRERPAGPEYGATVAAMNRNLESLSRDIAAAIKAFSRLPGA